MTYLLLAAGYVATALSVKTRLVLALLSLAVLAVQVAARSEGLADPLFLQYSPAGTVLIHYTPEQGRTDLRPVTLQGSEYVVFEGFYYPATMETRNEAR